MENVIILRRIFTIFGISLLITAILIYLYKGSFEKFSDNSKMLMHTVSVQEKTEELLGLVKDTESGTRGYVISDDEAFLEPFIIANLKLKTRIEDLRSLLKDNPTQLKTLDTLTNLIDRKLEFQRFIIHLKKTDNFKFGNKELMWNSKHVMDSIRVLISKMKSAQNTARIIRDLEVREATNNYRVLSTIFSITVLVIMICSLAYILWEIRSKKKVKNLLNAVLESSQSGIMSFNAVRSPEGSIVDFIFVQINRNGAEMLGYENSNMIGRSLFDIVPGTEVDELFDAYAEVIEKNTIYNAEKFYNRNKIKTWYRIIAVKLDDGVTVTFDDISKEKGYEEELKIILLN
ncbi:MAG: CHASE3 domain-containing protein [Bacteroidetes bacterium]|nr:CHASE3 domain-containing protein [Bacteroidota bacterium]